MKFLLYLFLAFLMPAFCRGEDVSLADSPDWTPMNAQQRDFAVKNTSDNRGRPVRFIDGTVYRPGGGRGTMVAMSRDVPLTKAVYDAEVKELFDGSQLPKNLTLVDQEPANVASLPGVFVRYRVKGPHGEDSILDYALFTDRAVYVVSIGGSESLARTDPLVTSYLARIRVDPSVVPPDINHSSGFSMASLSSYHLGRFSGIDLLVLGSAAVLIALIAKFVPGR